jgi:hypothetical protein
MGSFIIFEITWPDVVLSGIEFLKNVGDFIQIDLLKIPGLACPWASYSYETKFHVSMATPLVISVMLSMPVPIAWFLARVEEDEKKRNLHHNSQGGEEGFGSSDAGGFGGFGRGSSGTYVGMSGGQMVMGSAMGPGGAQFDGGGFGYFGGSSFSQPQQDQLYFGSQPAGGGFGSQPAGGDNGVGGFSQPASEDHDINREEDTWRLRYKKTVNTFMNNIMCVHCCDLLVELSFILTVKACVHE